jgi:hypothetical protein
MRSTGACEGFDKASRKGLLFCSAINAAMHFEDFVKIVLPLERVSQQSNKIFKDHVATHLDHRMWIGADRKIVGPDSVHQREQQAHECLVPVH